MVGSFVEVLEFGIFTQKGAFVRRVRGITGAWRIRQVVCGNRQGRKGEEWESGRVEKWKSKKVKRWKGRREESIPRQTG